MLEECHGRPSACRNKTRSYDTLHLLMKRTLACALALSLRSTIVSLLVDNVHSQPVREIPRAYCVRALQHTAFSLTEVLGGGIKVIQNS